MKNYKINLFNIYINLILLLPITTLLQNYIDSINRVLFVFIFILQLIVLFSSKIKFKYYLYLFLSLIIYIIALFNTKNLTFSNDIIYYINWLMFSCLICINKEKLQKWVLKSKKYIEIIIIVWSLIVFVSIFSSAGWYIKEGGTSYFGSFCGSIFRLGPSALFIATLSLLLITVFNKKKALFYTILPMFCGLMGSSRTYAFIIGITFIIALYLYFDNKKNFWKMLIPLLTLLAFFYTKSSLNDKVSYTLSDKQYGDLLFRITSSRSMIWGKIISKYNSLNIINRFIGLGHGASISITGTVYSHNDFIEILITYGIAGIILYIVSFYNLFKSYFDNSDRKFLLLLVIFMWLFNANFNMFYYYTCAAYSYPLLILAIKEFYHRVNPNGLCKI